MPMTSAPLVTPEAEFQVPAAGAGEPAKRGRRSGYAPAPALRRRCTGAAQGAAHEVPVPRGGTATRIVMRE
ncbi:hypothetical protein TARUN_6988 [Trichoderma arundinaceum]|uniref:Uncharacterized protein n=1 Tax=Trichoderma arundinaceum TaxID=490622 RepID=A0A395NGL1_TRIAR|nr:hypothetical protein TARUN_6988 [Trichoderma arundinaceum]